MTTYLPKEVQDGLDAARKIALRTSSRLRVVVDGEAFPILRLSSNGFVVPVDGTPRLRGLVDVYDGGRHLWQCLIIAAEADGPEMHYDFKRQTAALTGPALDFARSPDAPAGLLPRL